MSSRRYGLIAATFHHERQRATRHSPTFGASTRQNDARLGQVVRDGCASHEVGHTCRQQIIRGID